MAIPSSELTASAVLVFIFLVWVKRIVWMLRFRKTHPPLVPTSLDSKNPPKVSIIVPARNEEKNISNCLEHLSKQTYSHYEIIVVDDRSTDRTAELIEVCKNQTKIPIKYVRIEKLPAGWTGKNYAVFTGSKIALGDWILFTDADTTHQPQSVETSLAYSLKNKIDFLTLAPEVESKSFWEETVQPLAVSSLALWFDPEKINQPNSPVVLANGQYIFIKREVYEKVGGNEAVKNEVIEDVELAKKVRAAGYSVQFLNGINLYSTRMYSSLKEIKTGWTRIFTHLFNKNILSILHKIILFLLFSCVPFFILFGQIFLKIKSLDSFSPVLFAMSLTVCLWITVVRFFGNKSLKANPWYCVFHLLGSLVMIWILSICIGRILFKRSSVWRGEHYK